MKSEKNEKSVSEMSPEEFQIFATDLVNNYLNKSKVMKMGLIYVPESDEEIESDK